MDKATQQKLQLAEKLIDAFGTATNANMVAAQIIAMADLKTARSQKYSEQDGIEERYDKNGETDEILLWQNGKCLLHVERMDKNAFWMGVFGDGPENEKNFNFYANGKINLFEVIINHHS